MAASSSVMVSRPRCRWAYPRPEDAAPGVAQFDDSPLGALVAADPGVARDLAQRVLGRLLALDPEDRASLLATVEAWLSAGGSATAAGQALFCHPNTVRYRLRRAEELTGRSVGSCARPPS
jgi:DNA-binding PucR family transcriptional regulator